MLIHSTPSKKARTSFDFKLLKDAPSGGPSLDGFLKATDDDRVDREAPYPKDLGGHEVLDLHKQLREVAKTAHRAFPEKSVTLEGLSWALKTDAKQKITQAKALKEDEDKINSDVASKLKHLALETAICLAKNACIGLGIGAAAVAIVSLGVPLERLPGIMNLPLAVGIFSSVCVTEFEIGKHWDATFQHKIPSSTRQAVADLSNTANKEMKQAQHFDDWKLALQSHT